VGRPLRALTRRVYGPALEIGARALKLHGHYLRTHAVDGYVRAPAFFLHMSAFRLFRRRHAARLCGRHGRDPRRRGRVQPLLLLECRQFIDAAPLPEGLIGVRIRPPQLRHQMAAGVIAPKSRAFGQIPGNDFLGFGNSS
jgi:hypothetical protein